MHDHSHLNGDNGDDAKEMVGHQDVEVAEETVSAKPTDKLHVTGEQEEADSVV